MRTKNVVKNLLAAWIGQAIIILCNLISRWVIVKVLPVEYLGINGLFTNVLTVLSFADLGLGLSISYYLYEPLAKNDQERIKQIVEYYKKIYTIIGLIVMILGIMLLPCLDWIVKTNTISNIRLIYFMYVINASISYFNIHKVTLLNADQKGYICTSYTNIIKIFQIIVGAIVLYATQNYIIYYLVQIIATIITNILLSQKADKIYPFIKVESKKKDDNEIKTKIRENMGAMLLHKLSSVIVEGTDNLLISIFVNIVSVGLFSNYSMIINNIKYIVSQLFYSMSASVGNFAATENCEKKTNLFYNLLFLEFWLYGFCSICLYVLLNPFIEIWLGSKFLLGQHVVLVLVINFYLQGMRQVVLSFRNAEGLFKQDKYKAVLEASINFVVSLILVIKHGLIGTFVGTIVSTLSTCVWLEPFVLFRNGLKGGIRKYYMIYFKYIMEVFVVGGVTYKICVFLDNSIIGFCCRMLICMSVPNILFFLLNFRSNEMKEFKNRILSSFMKKRKESL